MRHVIVLLAVASLNGAVPDASGGGVLRALSEASAAYLTHDEPFARRWLEQLAAGGGNTRERSLATFVLATGDHRRGRYASAKAQFGRAVEACTELCDYLDYHYALTSAAAGDHAGAAAILQPFREKYPASPYLREALKFRITNLIRAGQVAAAQAELRGDRLLPTPERLLLLAKASAAAGDQDSARKHLVAIYVRHPTSTAAGEAQNLLAGATGMGASRLSLTEQERLARGNSLFGAAKYAEARSEYLVLSGRSGAAAAYAKLRLQALAIRTGQEHQVACTAIAKIHHSEAEITAERLYWLVECARKARDESSAEALLEQLNAGFPRSDWYERALLSYANYLLLNSSPRARLYYARLAQLFPESQNAAKAHWKAAWQAYLSRDPGAERLLQLHSERFGHTETGAAAAYWSGKIAEDRADLLRAHASYEQAAKRWPNQFYGLRASSRLSELRSTTPSAGVKKTSVDAKEVPKQIATRLSRSRLLSALSLSDLAELELRTLDPESPGAHWVGIELAERAVARGEYHAAVRWMKRFAPGYLSRSFDAYPQRFWELMFPLPWREQVVREASRHALDPHLVAALVRQESEFNPNALSKAGAHGLMQIMPATGAQLARSLDKRLAFRAPLLKQAEFNLQLGTIYLRSLIDQFGGAIETALAGYNAGPSRARKWSLGAVPPRSEEFVENIPFTETREYVQAVLRNREIYQRIYNLPMPTRLAENRFRGK